MSVNVAVVGGGWAGCAAALTLARSGVRVTLFEAAPVLGGRARRITRGSRCIDNGQHLLLGAYERSLALIASVHGGDAAQAMLRLPLSLHAAPGMMDDFSLTVAALPAPLHLLGALVGARGLSAGDKAATLRWVASQLLRRDSPAGTVAELLARQPSSARERLWEPLCVAALNTPAADASAAVFLEVLRRAFSGARGNSDLVIPRVDLSAAFPDPCMKEVVARGGELCLATPVLRLDPPADGGVIVVTRSTERRFHAAVIAAGPQHVARLLPSDRCGITQTLSALSFEPITTLHLDFPFVPAAVVDGARMLLLDGQPGQWLFWHALGNGQWRASVVISADHDDRDEAALTARVLSQLARCYALPNPIWSLAITEKRATWACTPAQCASLQALPRSSGDLHFAGDWSVAELPATLEAAVLSGERAAHAILASHRGDDHRA